MLNRRGVKAGLGRVHAHLLRHAFAHAWLSEGGNEGDLMRLAGWRTREMPATRHREPICGREKPIAGYHWAITSKGFGMHEPDEIPIYDEVPLKVLPSSRFDIPALALSPGFLRAQIANDDPNKIHAVAVGEGRGRHPGPEETPGRATKSRRARRRQLARRTGEPAPHPGSWAR